MSRPIGPDVVDRITARLEPTGLNRCQAAPVGGLPSTIWLDQAKSTDVLRGHRASEATLLLVGHGGPRLWEHLHETVPDHDFDFDFDKTPDPIDTFSITATESALEAELPAMERHLLYPHPDCPVDLVALGVHLGWHAVSPLGLGIHPDYGLWSAFRALWIVFGPATDISKPMAAPDVCHDCVPRSCVDACPANAVSVGQQFALMSCTDFRSKVESVCAETCLSRLACPVGIEFRYDEDQMIYHYRLSRPPAGKGTA